MDIVWLFFVYIFYAVAACVAILIVVELLEAFLRLIETWLEEDSGEDEDSIFK